MNHTVHGRIDNEDVDYFVIEAKKDSGSASKSKLFGLGMTFFDPYVAILNEARFELASSDDNASSGRIRLHRFSPRKMASTSSRFETVPTAEAELPTTVCTLVISRDRWELFQPEDVPVKKSK